MAEKIRKGPMREIYVSTIIDSYNYGTALQALATQNILKDYGDPIFIDYCREQWKLKTWIKTYLSDKNHSIIINIIRLCFGTPARLKSKKIFRGFITKNFTLCDSKPFVTGEGIDKLISNAVYCVGSDQTWNYIYNNGIDPVYYLANVPSAFKKIALSASFGRQSIDDREKFETLPILNQFDSISVRESSGVKILEQMGIENAIALKDPVILCEQSLWDSVSRDVSPINERGYVLVYMLNENEEMIEYARRIAQSNGIEAYLVTFNAIKTVPSGIKAVYLPEVSEWVALFRDAGLVVTDSFHGMSFSTIFNTPMVVFDPPKYSVRLTDALKDYGLTTRHVSGLEDAIARGIASDPIDWRRVNDLLNDERLKARKFLNSAFGMGELDGPVA